MIYIHDFLIEWLTDSVLYINTGDAISYNNGTGFM